jgi:hypothetical protein
MGMGGLIRARDLVPEEFFDRIEVRIVLTVHVPRFALPDTFLGWRCAHGFLHVRTAALNRRPLEGTDRHCQINSNTERMFLLLPSSLNSTITSSK